MSHCILFVTKSASSSTGGRSRLSLLPVGDPIVSRHKNVRREFTRMCGELFSSCSADDRGPEQGASVFRSNFGVSEAVLKTAASHFQEVVQECDDVRMRDELFSRCSADGRGPEQGASSFF